MGFNPKARIPLFACPVVLATLLLLSQPANSSTSPKVTLDYYYETLCPSCAYFFVNDLIRLFDSGIHSIVDLKLHPLGNAFVLPNTTILCQVILNSIFLCFSLSCQLSTSKLLILFVYENFLHCERTVYLQIISFFFFAFFNFQIIFLFFSKEEGEKKIRVVATEQLHLAMEGRGWLLAAIAYMYKTLTLTLIQRKGKRR